MKKYLKISLHSTLLTAILISIFNSTTFGQMSWLKVNAHIPSPNLAPNPSIGSYIIGSDILIN